MHILLTNDDGIHAPGLAAMFHALAPLGDVEVVAPAHAQTGVGHGITVQRALAVEAVEKPGGFAGWSVDGRPVDCVKLAMLHLLEHRPDFVISGINAGLNVGMYTVYSGTVAGAAEAALFFQVPAIAISLQCSAEMDFAHAARVARQVFTAFVTAQPPAGTCLNVNIPACGGQWPKGLRVCPRARHITYPTYRRTSDSSGRHSYCFDGGDATLTPEPGSDMAAILDGFVAVTPLVLDRSDVDVLATVATWPWPRDFVSA